MYERLILLSLGVVIIFAVFTVVNMYTLPEHAVLRTAVHDISVVVMFLLSWILFPLSTTPSPVYTQTPPPHPAPGAELW